MVLGAEPLAKPIGYVIWSTFGADRGAVASGTISGSTPNCSDHPADVTTSHGWSEITVNPAGSLGQGPLPGGTTVISARPLRPSEAAVIVAVPGATPVTTPAALTVAMP